MAQETALYRDDVEQVRRRWAEWRSTHAVRSRLPEELWAAAVELVQRDGIDATARALDVDKPSLRKWAGRLNATPSQAVRRKPLPKRRANVVPAFVELLAQTTGAAPSCLVEVESQRGAKLRLEWKGMQASELAELIPRVCDRVGMLQITPQMRILVAVEAVDFRKGIDSLAELCRAKLNADPFSGCLFVFRSRRATSIKVLVYDGQGFWLATKRLSKGRFRWWPQVAEQGAKEPTRALRVHQAQVLFAAGNPDVDAAPVWRKV